MLQLALCVSMLLALAALGLAALLLWPSRRSLTDPLARARTLWALALLFGPLGWVLLELGGLLRIGILSVVAKVALCATFVAFSAAAAALRGKSISWRWLALPLLMVATTSLSLYAREPHAPMRSGLLSLICAGLALGSAVLLVSHSAGERDRRMLWLAISFGLSATLLCLRGSMLLSDQTGLFPLWTTQAVASALLGASLALPLLATGLLLTGIDSRAPRASASERLARPLVR